MDLLTFVIYVLVFGALAFLILKAPFIPADWKPILNWVLLAILIIWLITLFLPGARSIHIGT
jgi:hypothetical protein